MTFLFNETDTQPISETNKKAPAFSPVKHAGFTKTIIAHVGHFTRTAFQLLMKKWSYHQDRLCVSRMLTLEDSVLEDMNIKRADIYYVLGSKSPLLASRRLKLLSIERRSLMRKDQERRKIYLEGLIPAPFNGGIKSHRKPDKTNA